MNTITVNGPAARDGKGGIYRPCLIAMTETINIKIHVYDQQAKRALVESEFAELCDTLDACTDPVKAKLLQAAVDKFPKAPPAFRFFYWNKDGNIAQGSLTACELGSTVSIKYGKGSKDVSLTTGKEYTVLAKEDVIGMCRLTYKGKNEQGHVVFDHELTYQQGV